eukprot:CAMPEP_0198370624 /NCGR_PEP_ID=MMETSP1450-20131203/156810_1 /TAXON_ID=753684 ORGANISM="Madagascaria erythrocladiodes, Strain CCMP3234" /NCGR_SAMPLE_ID=MMETSP1450 /ASSEMBLY_ACC=CAM_ASM_001115 /LENGTH=285 /DNA_ID=CAMNT_0044078165 /DNA_START=1 /DNA_END=855 /DNA_ORIENTATION=+
MEVGAHLAAYYLLTNSCAVTSHKYAPLLLNNLHAHVDGRDRVASVSGRDGRIIAFEFADHYLHRPAELRQLNVTEFVEQYSVMKLCSRASADADARGDRRGQRDHGRHVGSRRDINGGDSGNDDNSVGGADDNSDDCDDDGGRHDNGNGGDDDDADDDDGGRAQQQAARAAGDETADAADDDNATAATARRRTDDLRFSPHHPLYASHVVRERTAHHLADIIGKRMPPKPTDGADIDTCDAYAQQALLLYAPYSDSVFDVLRYRKHYLAAVDPHARAMLGIDSDA